MIFDELHCYFNINCDSNELIQKHCKRSDDSLVIHNKTMRCKISRPWNNKYNLRHKH